MTHPDFYTWLCSGYSITSAYQYSAALRALLRRAGLPDAPDGPFEGMHPEAITARVREALDSASPASRRNLVGAWNRWADYLHAVHCITLPEVASRSARRGHRAVPTPPELPPAVLSALLTILRPPVRVGLAPVPAHILASGWWGDVDTSGAEWAHATSLRLWYRLSNKPPQYIDTDAILPWFVLAAWASGVAAPRTRPPDHAPLVPSSRGGLTPVSASQLLAIAPSTGVLPMPGGGAPPEMVFYGDVLRLEMDPWGRVAPPARRADVVPQAATPALPPLTEWTTAPPAAPPSAAQERAREPLRTEIDLPDGYTEAFRTRPPE